MSSFAANVLFEKQLVHLQDRLSTLERFVAALLEAVGQRPGLPPSVDPDPEDLARSALLGIRRPGSVPGLSAIRPPSTSFAFASSRLSPSSPTCGSPSSCVASGRSPGIRRPSISVASRWRNSSAQHEIAAAKIRLDSAEQAVKNRVADLKKGG